MQKIDIRSDTVTHPTRAMRQAMAHAEVGDDVYQDDPTINALEAAAAALFGKEAALFCVSGVMSNLLAIMSQLVPGEQVILHSDSHIFCNQSGSVTLWGVLTRCVHGASSKVTVPAIMPWVKDGTFITNPRTRLVCLENALCNGDVYSKQEIDEVAAFAHSKNMLVHLDGARIFAAAITLGLSVKELCSSVDSVSFCLSKGLCCPIGSILVGTKDHIAKARKFRKMIGGGLRQAGILAAAGLYAFEHMIAPIKEDIEIAKRIAQQLSQLPGVKVSQTSRINMVFFTIEDSRAVAKDLVNAMANRGIAMNEPFQPTYMYRVATHHYIREKEADQIVRGVKDYIASLA